MKRAARTPVLRVALLGEAIENSVSSGPGQATAAGLGAAMLVLLVPPSASSSPCSSSAGGMYILGDRNWRLPAWLPRIHVESAPARTARNYSQV